MLGAFCELYNAGLQQRIEAYAAFTKATGIQVEYVEAGSGVVVNRIEKEQSNLRLTCW